MKLLFDQNLSPRLVDSLADLFPESSHVSLIGLDRALDIHIWTHAKANDFTIVTKDADFADIGQVHGSLPKIVWLRLGNCTTEQISSRCATAPPSSSR